MRIDIIRHGECADDAWLRGRTESELTESGHVQMSSQLLENRQYNLVVSSSALRCKTFVANQYSIYETSEKWRERDFGIFDGLSYENVKDLFPEELQAYLDEPFSYHIAQSESYVNFQKRIQKAWNQLISSEAESVLLITHGGPMRMILQSVLKTPNEALYHLELGYAAMISVEVYKVDEFECSRYSDTFCKLVEIKPCKEK